MMKCARRIAPVLVSAFLTLAGFAEEKTPMQKASELMQASKWDEAARAFETVVKADPANGQAWLQLSRAYHELGKPGEAIEAAKKAIAAGYQPRVAMISVARGHAAKGDRETALKTIEEIAAGGSSSGLKSRLESTQGFDSIKSDPRWAAAIRKLTPCTDPAYRQFDFWLGDFSVEDPNGNFVGDNEITLHLDGCMLLENWKGASGMRGMSMNFYDPTDQTWNQIFVDNAGDPSQWPPLKGRFENGSMVMLSPAAISPLNRWTWTKLPDGRVRQKAEASTDGGKTWVVTWDSFYSRKR